MASRWISYSVDEDRRSRRDRRWRLRWPWNWGRGPGYGRPHVVRDRPSRQRGRSRDDGERRSIWPWLLLLLLLLLFLGALVLFLLDDPEENGNAEQTGGTGEPAAPAAPADLVAGGVVPPVGSALALTRADDGSTMVSVPERPSLRLGEDAKVIDLGDGSCHDQRYVLMTDGKAVPIEDLDEATVDALARSNVAIDTVALSPGADTSALRAIASRTGGTFTKME